MLYCVFILRALGTRYSARLNQLYEVFLRGFLTVTGNRARLTDGFQVTR
jgi:hypothetical protein